MSRFSLPKDVSEILGKLENAGYRADIVGGPVRDLLRGVEPHDFDITTSALPEETKAVFAGERIVETGIKHGTVSLIKNGEQYEITTYRIDGEYEDSRHPKSVSFTERIEEDLARRDFTVNAIAYSEKRGITDPFGGSADIEKKIIRAVGDAEKRFDEDALRIIRGIRFASTLGFAIEEETKAAMLKKAHLLENISKERILVEWKKLLDGSLAIEILEEYKPITDLFFPEAALPEGLNREAFFEASPLARHISLFAKAGEGAYRSAMRRLKTDNQTAKFGAEVISALGKYDRDLASAAFMLRDLGAGNARLLRECEAILGYAEKIDLSDIEAVEQSGIPYKLSDLAVNGNDLLAIGYKGAEIKATLATLQSRVLCGELINDKKTLLDYLSKL
jgi:tRNA nucleotidyltransferase (CCA-adding enzyme)